MFGLQASHFMASDVQPEDTGLADASRDAQDAYLQCSIALAGSWRRWRRDAGAGCNASEMYPQLACPSHCCRCRCRTVWHCTEY